MYLTFPFHVEEEWYSRFCHKLPHTSKVVDCTRFLGSLWNIQDKFELSLQDLPVSAFTIVAIAGIY